MAAAASTARPAGMPAGDLGAFDDAELEELVAHLGSVRHPAGKPLARVGERVGEIGLIVSGEVELVRRRYDRRRVVLQILRRGDVFGDVAHLCDQPLAFEVRALTVTEVVHLPAEVLRRLLATRPHVCQRFVYSLAVRLESLQRRVLELTAGDVSHRIATLLLDETGGGHGTVAITQTALAQLLDATRPSVNESLKRLEEAGALLLGYGRVEVIDPAHLTALVKTA